LAAPPDVDVQLLSLLNHPGTPWLDGVMGRGVEQRVLWRVAALAAIYLWLKSPHRALAAVLMVAAIAAADLVYGASRETPGGPGAALQGRPGPRRVTRSDAARGSRFPRPMRATRPPQRQSFSWGALDCPPWDRRGAAGAGSRAVYLGVHWPTDVLAGWALGAAVGRSWWRSPGSATCAEPACLRLFSTNQKGNDHMHIIGFIIFGLVIGLLARAVYPGRQNMGWLSTAVLGMIGSLVGGLIGHALFGGTRRRTAPGDSRPAAGSRRSSARSSCSGRTSPWLDAAASTT